jgi:uncharacterized protein with HEPN domain
MRLERLYLDDIVEAAGHIADFLTDCDRSCFDASELIRSAIVQKMGIIGEASSRISQALRQKHPEIPWTDVIGFRNILVHDYFGTDWDIVWEAATISAPTLRRQILAILADYPAT